MAAELAVPDLSFLLAHASHVLETRMTAALAEVGLTPRDVCVLTHALPGNLTQIELARVTDLDKTTMVVTLDALEDAGYAERLPDATDRRARRVTVTGQGREITAAGRAVVDQVHAEVLAELPPPEREVFISALNHLVKGLLAEPVESERPVRRPRRQAAASAPR